jgi:hypothetical protein
MRFAWLFLLVLAGCPAADDGGDYPVRPGVGGGTIIGDDDRPDAPPGPDAAPATMGRVCVTSDPRDWNPAGPQCASGPVGLGLTVTIGTDSTTTMAGGYFVFTMPPVGATIKVTGTVIPSIRKLTDPSDLDTVAIIDASWLQWQNDTNFGQTDGNTALVIELHDNGSRRSGFTATSNPPPGALAGNEPFYDDPAGSFMWNNTGTNTQSKALFADVPPAGTVAVTATIDSRMATESYPVEPDSITFGYLDVPPP